MYRPEVKVFNDSVHGHITLPQICVQIMDTPAFQRLRNIKQMGVTNLVYQGACNTRFEHDLGVCFLAGKMADALNANSEVSITEEEKECLQVAGLCHDLGHGPFSHMWDRVVDREDYSHENMSLTILDYLVDNNQFLGRLNENVLGFHPFITKKDLIKRMIKGIENPTEEPFREKLYLFQVIANKQNGIDVDKWDSFLRDGLHLNLRTTFDYRRLLEFCRIQRVQDGTMQICFRAKEAYNIYEMFVNRATLHHKAYQHPVKCCIEEMLLDAFRKHNETLPLERKWSEISMRAQNGNRPFVEEFLKLTDEYTMRAVQEGNSEAARTILNRISSRRLYKRIPRRPIRFSADQQEAMKTDFIPETNADPEHYSLNFMKFKLGSEHGDNPLEKIFFYTWNEEEVTTRSINEISIFGAPREFKYTAVQVLYKGAEEIHVPEDIQNTITNFLRRYNAPQ